MNQVHIIKARYSGNSISTWQKELEKTINFWIIKTGVEVIKISTNIDFGRDDPTVPWYHECVVTILYKQK